LLAAERVLWKKAPENSGRREGGSLLGKEECVGLAGEGHHT